MSQIKNNPRCPICGSPRGGCSSLERATPTNGHWCSLLEEAYAAAIDGVQRCKHGDFPKPWYDRYCRRGTAGTWGNDPELRQQTKAILTNQP
jgi:hypothetical protein